MSQADTTPRNRTQAEQTRQQTLNGGYADRRRGKPPDHAKRGYAEILWRAPPSTSWRRAVTWCLRAEEEGVIR